ncbi:MAG: 30S ribosomal protein S27e [Candidatus Thorarchaeota archaeon]
MTKKKKTIDEPRSRFLLVKCKECDHEQTVFGRATQKVVCDVCGKPLTKPTGGKAQIIGEVIQELS